MSERVLCCGSRLWHDYHTIRRTLDQLHADGGIERVIHGDCRGADRMAAAAALGLGIPVIAYPALWNEYGPAAGPLRNHHMLDEEKPTLMLAFHDELEASKGTADMVRRARKAGVPIRIVTTNNTEDT